MPTEYEIHLVLREQSAVTRRKRVPLVLVGRVGVVHGDMGHHDDEGSGRPVDGNEVLL